MIRFLIYSLCLFGIVSCKTYQPNFEFIVSNQEIKNPYFADLNQEYIYTVTISAYKKTISGILVIKAIDNITHRVLMATEFGNTLLDLTVTPTGYAKNYAMPDLDKKIILNLLSHDFFVMLNENWTSNSSCQNLEESIYKTQFKNKTYYLTYTKNKLYQIDYVGSKKKMQVNFNEVDENQAKKIQLQHYNLDITIQMTQI